MMGIDQEIRKCMVHGGYDSDGDGRCSVYESAHPDIRENMENCKLQPLEEE